LDKFAETRSNAKNALAKPFTREIDELNRKVEDIARHQDDAEEVFDDETKAELRKRTLVFDEGFDAFQPSFTELDEFLQKEKLLEPIRGTGYLPGVYTNITDGTETITNNNGNIYYSHTGTQGSSGSTGTSGFTGSPSPEDLAETRIATLKTTLQRYADKIAQIKTVMNKLEEEARRLTLINNHLADDRIYKLDMNKLSAFGFEDISA
jgi:hypothetical protein